MPQTVILRGVSQRGLAHRLIDAAPVGAVVTVKEATLVCCLQKMDAM